MRDRKGPALVHATVTRPYSHSFSDDEKLYKTPGEREAEARRDPLVRMRQFLLVEELATEEDLTEILTDVEREVTNGRRGSVDALRIRNQRRQHSTSSLRMSTPRRAGSRPSLSRRARATRWSPPSTPRLKDEMANDPRIVVFGQDVADASHESALPLVAGKGGVFKATHGLQRAFGSDRVFNSPLAEANIVGRAVGMALRGLKPVVEIQFFDYIWPAFMQIRDELAMMRYRSGNHWSCPVVIRVPIGGYLRGGAPYHSQSGVSIFAHTPGIRIVLPSNAQDAAGLLRTAIRCDDPVLFCEHKHLYRQTYNKAPYPGPDYMVPLGKAAVTREGTDVVVFTWGALVQRSLLAAQQAERLGISVAVIDLRSIIPYDWETIAAYTKKTSRVIVAHEDQLTCGFGAEIAARISEELFEYLDAPVKRVAALDCPVAYAPVLEEQILPGTSRRAEGDQDGGGVLGSGLTRLWALGVRLSATCRLCSTVPLCDSQHLRPLTRCGLSWSSRRRLPFGLTSFARLAAFHHTSSARSRTRSAFSRPSRRHLLRVRPAGAGRLQHRRRADRAPRRSSRSAARKVASSSRPASTSLATGTSSSPTFRAFSSGFRPSTLRGRA